MTALAHTSQPEPVLQVITRAQALSRGLNDTDIARLRRRGDWRRIGRGVYAVSRLPMRPLPSGPEPPAGPTASRTWRRPDLSRARPAAVAAVLRGSRSTVLAGLDAALAWGLPAPLEQPPRIELLRSSGATRVSGAVRVAVRRSWDEPVLGWEEGPLVTGPLTTVVDCAHLLAPRDALAMADAAVRAGLVRAEDVAAVRRRLTRRPRTAVARRVLDLVDGRRESPLESWSAWAFDEAGIPPPQWQVTILRAGAGFVARVDCLWAGLLVGEADGRVKAGLHRATRDGWSIDAVGRVLEDERRRESGLRSCGLDIIRWSARDLLDPLRCAALMAEIRERLARLADEGRVLAPDTQLL